MTGTQGNTNSALRIMRTAIAIHHDELDPAEYAHQRAMLREGLDLQFGRTTQTLAVSDNDVDQGQQSGEYSDSENGDDDEGSVDESSCEEADDSEAIWARTL